MKSYGNIAIIRKTNYISHFLFFFHLVIFVHGIWSAHALCACECIYAHVCNWAVQRSMFLVLFRYSLSLIFLLTELFVTKVTLLLERHLRCSSKIHEFFLNKRTSLVMITPQTPRLKSYTKKVVQLKELQQPSL